MTLQRKTTMTMVATMEVMTMGMTVLMMLVPESGLEKQREVQERMMATIVIWISICWQRASRNQKERVMELKEEMQEVQLLPRAFRLEPLLEVTPFSLMTNRLSQVILRTRRVTQVKQTSRKPKISRSPRSNLRDGLRPLQQQQRQREPILLHRQC